MQVKPRRTVSARSCDTCAERSIRDRTPPAGPQRDICRREWPRSNGPRWQLCRWRSLHLDPEWQLCRRTLKTVEGVSA
jgi:hypothetical protein